MKNLKQGKLTGHKATAYGLTLPEVRVEGGASYPDKVEVDGVAYYVHDFGGFWVGSRSVYGADAGGNEVNPERFAPASRVGIAAPRGRTQEYVQASYSEPEVIFAD